MTDDNSNDNDNDNDVLIRQRVREFLSNSNAKFPYIINSDEIRTLTYLLANTGLSLDSPQALDGHQKWYWVTDSTVIQIWLGRYSRSNTWRLPPEIGNMIGLERLSLYGCSSLPPEIAKLESLKLLGFACCDDQIDLPQVEMPALEEFCVSYGIWDKKRTTALLSWLSVYAPKLTRISIYHLSREDAILFINTLLEPDISGRVNLVRLGIEMCGLIEVDAETIILDLLPLYPNITGLHLAENEIKSLKTIGETATKMKSTIITKQLKSFSLYENPCFSNLNKTSSSDHISAISLLKHFKQLRWLGHSKKTIRPTTEIEYWTKINNGGRHLVDGYKKIVPEYLWPNILERAYRSSYGGPYAKKKIRGEDTHDATAMFYLIREGPLFSGKHKLSTPRHCSEILKNTSKKRKRENQKN